MIRDIPNTFAKNVKNDYLSVADILLGLQTGFFKYEKLPDDVKKKFNAYLATINSKFPLPNKRDILLKQAKFDESKINRDKDGKFADKPGSGGGGSSKDKLKSKSNRTYDKNGFDNTETEIIYKVRYGAVQKRKLAEIQKEYEEMDDEQKAKNKEWYEQKVRWYSPPNYEVVKNAWNSYTPEQRKNVKGLELFSAPSYKHAGEFLFRTKTVRMNLASHPTAQPGTLEHEIAHADFEVESIDKQNEYDRKIAPLPAISEYAASFRPGEKRDAASKMERVRKYLEQIETELVTKTYSEVEKSIPYLVMQNVNEHHGFTIEDYGSGVVRGWFDVTYPRKKLLAANENHSEFLRIKNVDTHEQDENFKKHLKVHNEVFG